MDKEVAKLLKDISDNWYKQIEENRQKTQSEVEARHRDLVANCVNTLRTKIEKAFTEETTDYVKLGNIVKTSIRDWEYGTFGEAVKQLQACTAFKFYIYKATQFHFDFWNYVDVYGVVAAQNKEDLENFKKDEKPLHICIIKEL